MRSILMITSHFLLLCRTCSTCKKRPSLFFASIGEICKEEGRPLFLSKDCFGKFRQLGHDIVARSGVDPVARHRVGRLPDSIGRG